MVWVGFFLFFLGFKKNKFADFLYTQCENVQNMLLQHKCANDEVNQGRILKFSVKGVGGLARGVGNFSPLTLLIQRFCAAPRLRQAIAYCWTFFKFIFLICLGTYFVRELIRQPWLYSKM